jgi:tRNA (cytidine/uridine-2'-O-)-methyltransferase
MGGRFDDDYGPPLRLHSGLTTRPAAVISNSVNSPTRLHIVLHQPEIPQNTGNISRTCVAIGAKLWLVRPLGFQLDAKHLRRAGLDYWRHLDWEVVDRWEDLPARWQDFRPWLFSKTASRLYTDVSYQSGDALVFGAETSGLPADLLARHPERCLRIPISPRVRSLNLSNAVAVAAYEAIRQWGPGLVLD